MAHDDQDPQQVEIIITDGESSSVENGNGKPIRQKYSRKAKAAGAAAALTTIASFGVATEEYLTNKHLIETNENLVQLYNDLVKQSQAFIIECNQLIVKCQEN